MCWNGDVCVSGDHWDNLRWYWGNVVNFEFVVKEDLAWDNIYVCIYIYINRPGEEEPKGLHCVANWYINYVLCCSGERVTCHVISGTRVLGRTTPSCSGRRVRETDLNDWTNWLLTATVNCASYSAWKPEDCLTFQNLDFRRLFHVFDVCCHLILTNKWVIVVG